MTFLSTGSEIEFAVSAAEKLKAEGVKAAVVSMPCWELFEQQPAEYQAKVLGTAPRVAIEAASRFGWDRWIGANGAFIGMNGFGASGPAARSTSTLASQRKPPLLPPRNSSDEARPKTGHHEKQKQV